MSTRSHTLFPYSTLFRSQERKSTESGHSCQPRRMPIRPRPRPLPPLHVAILSLPESGTMAAFGLHEVLGHARSEEHTYEIQSLMSISYAVFCLKKKK